MDVGNTLVVKLHLGHCIVWLTRNCKPNGKLQTIQRRSSFKKVLKHIFCAIPIKKSADDERYTKDSRLNGNSQ